MSPENPGSPESRASGKARGEAGSWMCCRSLAAVASRSGSEQCPPGGPIQAEKGERGLGQC